MYPHIVDCRRARAVDELRWCHVSFLLLHPEIQRLIQQNERVRARHPSSLSTRLFSLYGNRPFNLAWTGELMQIVSLSLDQSHRCGHTSFVWKRLWHSFHLFPSEKRNSIQNVLMVKKRTTFYKTYHSEVDANCTVSVVHWSVPFQTCIHNTIWPAIRLYLSRVKIKVKLRHKGRVSAIAQPKQEEVLTVCFHQLTLEQLE